MSEVKRYKAWIDECGENTFILASDYDTREQQWREVVRELHEHLKLEVRHCNCEDAPDGHFCLRCNKRLDLIGAGTLLNEPQPQEDKSHDAT